MEYLFEVKAIVSVDSRLFKSVETDEKALQLIADGYGHIVSQEINLVEKRGE